MIRPFAAILSGAMLLVAGFAQAAPLCENVFLSQADADRMIDELARLAVQTRQVMEPREKTLLASLLRTKFSEIEAHVGPEVRALVQERMAREQTSPRPIDKKTRVQSERQEINPLSFVFSEKATDLKWLRPFDFDSGGANGFHTNSEVGWTPNGRFLVLRDRKEKTRIYDLQARAYVKDVPFKNGWFGNQDAVWFQESRNSTTVTNLRTGQNHAPFTGRAVSLELISENFFVKKISVRGKVQFFHQDLKTGTETPLGTHLWKFRISADGSRIYRQTDDTIEVLQNGQLIHKIPGVLLNTRTDDVGFFVFHHKNETFAARMSDGAVRPIPVGFTAKFLSNDGTQLLVQKTYEWHVLEFDSGRTLATAQPYEAALSASDGAVWILRGNSAQTSELWIPATQTRKALDHGYTSVSPNQRWLTSMRRDPEPVTNVYDLKTDRAFEIKGVAGIQFLGRTDLYMSNVFDRDSQTRTHQLADLSIQSAPMEVTRGSISVSPDGRYILTLKDGQLTLFEVHP